MPPDTVLPGSVRDLSASFGYPFRMRLLRRTFPIISLAMLAAALAFPIAARADDDDHERARSALEQGKARPLAEILRDVGPKLGGRIVDVEFDTENGVYVYEFKVIRPDGRVREVYVNAQTGRILKVEAD
jgi:uncharacterized membrane protein YkoI